MTDDKAIINFISACLGKTAFLTMRKARIAAARIYKESGLQLYSYSCPHCGCVHLTRQKHGSSHFEYRAYKTRRTLWEKEHEFDFDNAAVGTNK